MAASLVIEEELGTSTGRVHAHNGYYAGDFSNARHETAATYNKELTYMRTLTLYAMR